MNLLAHSTRRSATLAALVLATTVAAPASASIVADPSFEAAAYPPNWYAYNATGSPWTFAGNSGVTYLPSAPFGSSPAPSGVQVAFLQTNVFPTGWGDISQPITLPATGTYTLSYLHAGRYSNFGGFGNTTYDVLIDSIIVATHSTVTAQPFTPVSFNFTASGGAHTLSFRFNAIQPFGDNTVLFDDVEITAVPAPGPLAIAAAAGIFFARRRR